MQDFVHQPYHYARQQSQAAGLAAVLGPPPQLFLEILAETTQGAHYPLMKESTVDYKGM